MKFPSPLHAGTFLRRYKRFFADVELDTGEHVTAHCPNPGSMKSCLKEGAPVWLSYTDNPKRKLAYTWELARIGKAMVFVNPVRANDVVAHALTQGAVSELAGYSQLQREVRYGDHSRVDFVLTEPERPACFVEVKNVTLSLGGGRAAFPDSVTERGARHLGELAKIAQAGKRAVLLFCVSRTDAKTVEPAEDIDPNYAHALRAAAAQGVEILAYRASISAERVALRTPIPVIF